jgi:class 3 adenylate cyclase/predicted ATPase
MLTVMFCDLVGSTELSLRLDPEDLRDVVRDYQRACATAISRFEGTIAQYLGDGILAYFGYPVAHEDDALRGVRAGLGILHAMEELGHARSSGAGRLSVRVGIHTGVVVVGEMGEAGRTERLALGDTPNLAARLQALAPPDGVVISPATDALTRGFFRTRSLGPQSVKGKPEPIEVLQVLEESGLRHRLEAPARLSPYVGRREELHALESAWRRASEGAGQAVLVVGDAGLGKSRLVPVLKERIPRASYTLREMFCSPYYTSSAFHPVSTLLNKQLGLEGEPPARLAALQAHLPRLGLDLEEGVPLLAALLSIPPEAGYQPLRLPPSALKQKTLELLASLLLSCPEGRPVLLVAEDLHWVDPSTLELLELLLPRIAGTRAMLLATARPSFDRRWPGASRLTLSGLPAAEAFRLVASLAGGRALPAPVVSLLLEKTDGVPLFVEEMTRMVLESALLRATDSGFELAGSLSDVPIPATLQGWLLARLDRMDPDARKAAQLGATAGREFPLDLLAAVLPGEEAALAHGLDELEAAQLVYRVEEAARPNYVFKHALIQDAAYESLLKRTRQRYHASIAAALERDFPDLVRTRPERLAQHHTRAGQPEQAIPYWLRAGQRAVAASANAEAAEHLRLGLELVGCLPAGPERDRLELELLSTLGTALSALKGYASPEVERAYARAHELCLGTGQTPQLFWVEWGLWAFYLVQGDHEKALSVGRDMMALASARGEEALELEAHFSLGLSLFFMGQPGAAREHLETAVAVYRPERHHENAYQTTQDVGVTSRSVAALDLWLLGETALALQRSREALDLADRLGHPFSKAYALGCAAWLNLWLRDLPAAARYAQEAVALSREQGFGWWLVWGTILGGRAEATAGEADSRVRQIQDGIAAWRGTGSGFTVPYFLALLAEACEIDGQQGEARRLLAEARALIERTGEGFFAAEIDRIEGDLLQAARPPENEAAGAAIEKLYRRAAATAQGQGARAFELRASRSLARHLRDLGRLEEARAVLEPICLALAGGPETKDLTEARAVLSTLSGPEPGA